MLKKYPELVEKTLTKESKHTPLMRAVYNGDEKMADLILEHNANVNAANKKGATALITAVKRNHFEIVKKLVIERKAEIDVQDRNSLSPLDYAILSGFYESAYFLHERSKEKTMKSA